MKKLTYLFLALIIVACGNETKKNDLTESNLYGKVKSLTSKEYEVIEKFGEITKGEILYRNYKVKYDDKGDETESSSYNSDGSLVFKTIYEYDDKGNETESSRYNSDGSLDFKNTYEYEFDNKGNWINVIIYSKGVATGIQEREIVYYTL